MDPRKLLILKMMALTLALIGSASIHPNLLVAQDATLAPEVVLSDNPKFALLPVGEHPDGYFKDIEVQAGDSVELTVAIDNGSAMPLSLRTYKVNALSGVNGGYVSGDPDEEPIGATAWIEYPTVTLDIVPGGQEFITFNVSVPDGTAPGQYLSGLVVETADTFAVPGTDILDQVISYAISVGIVVPGDIVHSFELGDPVIEGRYLDVPVSNTGNFLVRPVGEIVLSDSEGKELHTGEINMGSIYAGLDTYIRVILPEQMPSGDLLLNLVLTDEASGAGDSIEGIVVTVEESVDSTGVSVANAVVEPNADEIVFANVNVTLDNGGIQIPASNVTLEVMRDGEQVDTFPLATNQVLLSGENQFVTRYLPADMWQSGEYTFRISVSAVDPNGGQETILMDEELDATIVVP